MIAAQIAPVKSKGYLPYRFAAEAERWAAQTVCSSCPREAFHWRLVVRKKPVRKEHGTG